MSSMKKNTASGVITFHKPFSVILLKPEEHTADVKDTTETRKSPSLLSVKLQSTSGCVRVEKRDEEASWLSHTPLRQLQAKMEAENQQARKIAETLQDTENGFMKELERFLSRWDETELRRRELLHKHWTERVWFPLQSRVEAHVSSCGPAEAKRRLSLYSDYLHHCNTKGYVFLDTYDLKDYNPFLLNIKKPHFSKLRTNDTKDPLYLQLHQRPPEKRTTCSYDAEYTRGHVEKLPQNDRHLTDSVMPQADTPLLTSSNYLASPSTNTPVKDETGGRKSSRLDTIPHNGNAAPDGRCHCTGSCFSRCGCRE